MRFKVTEKPRAHMIDLSDLSPFPDMMPPDDIDLEDMDDIEKYIYAHQKTYDELVETLPSLVNDEFPLHLPDRLFFYYEYADDQLLYYQILTRMLEASYNEATYVSIADEPMESDNDDKSDTSDKSDDGSSSEGSCSDNGEACDSSTGARVSKNVEQTRARNDQRLRDRESDDDQEEYRSDNDDREEDVDILPPPRGIPQPKASTVYMEELSAQRTRTTKESTVAASRPTEIKSNFVKPDKPPAFQGIEPVKLRPGIDMDKFEYNGVQITAFKNRTPAVRT